MAGDDHSEAQQEGETPPPKKKSKMLFIIIGGVVLLLVCGGAGFFFLSGMFSPKKDEAGKEAAAAAKPKEPAYFDVPDMLVNLNGAGRKTNFLKVTVSIELDRKEDQPKVQESLPRIVDTFQTYMRELRPEDLRGSAGLYRLREELLARVNLAVAPIKVDDVLFREMLVQ